MNGHQIDKKKESKKIEQTHTIKIHRLILKFIWKCKGSRRVEPILEINFKKKDKTENLYCMISHLLQSYSNQDNVVLSLGQTNISAEQNNRGVHRPTTK